MRRADWYFDFISPFSYFALGRLDELRGMAEVRLRPVLFAALLDHHGQKGPAEISSKRTWAYRYCVWHAARLGIPFRFPAAHPFNPLPYLRMAVALDGEPGAVRRIFEALWTTGADPADPETVTELARSLELDLVKIGAPQVKDALRRATARAMEAGVFGVPTLVIDGHPFWGTESIDFARDYLADPDLFDGEEMRRVGQLPAAASRTQVAGDSAPPVGGESP